MNLAPGTKLGRYAIVDFLGAGGMGQVYRARDEQLARDVAIKVLPAQSIDKPQVVQRFQQEARALGLLNHPNLVTVYDFGTYESSFYIVLELLEGQTLRACLREGPIAQRKAIQYAIQIARGMAAAHERGIIHRDLKPENIFLTRDGRLKILDFGLAKMTPEFASAMAVGDDSPTLFAVTNPGMVMGTVGYMAPEQLRSEPSDERADIFAFGAIVYEMLSGRGAFRQSSPVETMSAVLKDDPPDLDGLNIAPGLELVIARCLEKDPEQRFQSARDLSFALEALTGSTESLTAPLTLFFRKSMRRIRYAAAIAAALAITFVLGAVLWSRTEQPQHPSFRQLTFRRGDVSGARFAPDGASVVYTASWEGGGYELYSTRPDNVESRPLNIPCRELLAVSKKGDLAILIDADESSGTLAVVSLGGGAPREVASNVQAADWSADGKLAVARVIDGHYQLEYPIGTILHQSPTRMRDLRVSPDGQHVAFRVREARLGKNYALYVIDAAGIKPRKLGEWTNAKGLTWAADGKNVIFASNDGGGTAVHEVSLSGKPRLLARFDGMMKLHDMSPNGELLLTRDDYREGIMSRAPGAERERDLSWFDGSGASDITGDGQRILMSEFGEAGGPKYSVYVRNTNGDPAIRLGDGYGVSLSPDGASALVIVPGVPAHLAIVPIGPGQARVLETGELEDFEFGTWMPDGRSILFTGRTRDGRMRIHRMDVPRGKPVPVADIGYRLALASRPVSPDGKLIAASSVEGGIAILTIDGSAPPRKLNIERNHRPIGWTADGSEIFVYVDDQLPARVYRYNVTSGAKTLVHELMPPDAAGVYRIMDIVLTPDGASYAYGVMRNLSTLYLMR